MRTTLRVFAVTQPLLWLVSSLTVAQNRQPLNHDVYDFWNRIEESQIADDGRWVLYVQGPEDGDGVLIVRQVDDPSAPFRVDRGKNASFSRDSRHVVSLIAAPRDSVRQAELDEKDEDEMPKDSLGILELATGSVYRSARVRSYKIPKEAGGIVAYLKEPEVDSTEDEDRGEHGQTSNADDEEGDREDGTQLTLLNLESGAESTFEFAVEYALSEDGRWMAYTARSEDGTADGLFAVSTTTGTAEPVLTGRGDYQQVVFDKSGRQLAFVSNVADFEADQPHFALYRWRVEDQELDTLVTSRTDGIPGDWWVSEHGQIVFSESGNRVFFGTAPRPDPDEEDKVPDDERVKVDVWHWQDPLLQTMQLVQLEDEQKRSYRAVFHFEDRSFVQLATLEVPEVELGRKGDADVVLGISNLPYQQSISWDYPLYYDAYVVDVETGEHRRAVDRMQYRPAFSPSAKYIYWWDRDELAWYVRSVSGGEAVRVSAGIEYPLQNELHDWPYGPDPYGDAGWTTGDETLLIYDRYDVWAVDPVGSVSPRNVTNGYGRTHDVRFRYLKLDPEEDAIDSDEPMLMSAFNRRTKGGGFYRDRVSGDGLPVELVLMDRRFSTPAKSRDADRLLFTRESFAEFPDLWVSSLDMESMLKVSAANPQQSDYRWGTVELMTWRSLDGTPLTGLLYKPDDFDASRKYPMMVYFYEKNSDNLHGHHAPAPHRSVINRTFYVSRGYVVFVPDIPYKVGYPGESALNAVLPGVTELIGRGFVDEDNIGVQGHSWGGYQIAYMITRTNLFKAAEAGAPVSNMVSAYGGIRWRSGMSRMWQYEQSQSRIGGTLWEHPLRYIENSPIFWADKIQTPLLIMHNDKDGAVPWYQGIELFVALRRLGRPVWMINYNDEPHWPTTFANKKDWAIRLQQYFDHYLKGAPAPVWITDGIPAISKGKTLGYETESAAKGEAN